MAARDEIHVEKAAAIADLGVHPGATRPTPISANCDELVRCQYFVTELVRLAPGAPHTPTPEVCQMWVWPGRPRRQLEEAFPAGRGVAVAGRRASSRRLSRNRRALPADLRTALTDHASRGTVDGDSLAVLKRIQDARDVGHGRDAILAGDNRAVAQKSRRSP